MRRFVASILLCVLLCQGGCQFAAQADERRTQDAQSQIGEAAMLPYWYKDYGYDSATNVVLSSQDTYTWRMIIANHYKTYTTSCAGRPPEIAYFLDGIDGMERAQQMAARAVEEGVSSAIVVLASFFASGGRNLGAAAAPFELWGGYAAAAPYINQCETYRNNLLMWWDVYQGE